MAKSKPPYPVEVQLQISAQGMRVASTANGWRVSIMVSKRARKKSSVTIGSAPQNSQKAEPIGFDSESYGHEHSPRKASIHAGCRRFAGRTKEQVCWTPAESGTVAIAPADAAWLVLRPRKKKKAQGEPPGP